MCNVSECHLPEDNHNIKFRIWGYLLYKYEVGDTITVKIYRGSEQKQIKITLSDTRKD